MTPDLHGTSNLQLPIAAAEAPATSPDNVDVGVHEMVGKNALPVMVFFAFET